MNSQTHISLSLFSLYLPTLLKIFSTSGSYSQSEYADEGNKASASEAFRFGRAGSRNVHWTRESAGDVTSYEIQELRISKFATQCHEAARITGIIIQCFSLSHIFNSAMNNR